jgi:hypothetical protein
MAFQTRSFIDGKKTAMIYQTTDTIAVHQSCMKMPQHNHH